MAIDFHCYMCSIITFFSLDNFSKVYYLVVATSAPSNFLSWAYLVGQIIFSTKRPTINSHQGMQSDMLQFFFTKLSIRDLCTVKFIKYLIVFVYEPRYCQRMYKLEDITKA